MFKKLRWFLPILVALAGIFAIVAPVLASIPQPTALEIQDIAAYENTKEDGDQLYLVTYYIAINTTYDADDLFIFRLLDEDDNDIASTRPYPFYNDGYGIGVVAFYLDPDEAPTWQSGVSIQIAGNPLASWNGSAPSTTSSIVEWNTGTTQEMNELVSVKIMALASELERWWDTEMTTTTQGTTILSDTGASYFLRVVPYLSTVAPYVLGQYTYTPDFPEEKPPSDSYVEELESGISGTIFDLSGPARSFGITRGQLTAAIYYPFVIGFIFMLMVKKGLRKGAMLIAWPFVVAGAFFGVPLHVTIIGAFICLVATVWIFYKGVTT